MKKIKISRLLGSAAILVLGLSAAFTACRDSGKLEEYEVKFVTNCAANVETRIVKDGQRTTQPSISNPGHNLVGWFTEATFENQWNFDSHRVTSDITLYAQWTPLSQGQVDPDWDRDNFNIESFFVQGTSGASSEMDAPNTIGLVDSGILRIAKAGWSTTDAKSKLVFFFGPPPQSAVDGNSGLVLTFGDPDKEWRVNDSITLPEGAMYTENLTQGVFVCMGWSFGDPDCPYDSNEAHPVTDSGSGGRAHAIVKTLTSNELDNIKILTVPHNQVVTPGWADGFTPFMIFDHSILIKIENWVAK